MRITKFGHACVRIESGGSTLVLDPGGFTEPGAVDGADAVLITHEHVDHYSADLLKRADCPVYTIAAVAAAISGDDEAIRERVTVVGPGERFEAAGVSVEAVGEMHAIIHPDNPMFFNSGYLVRGDQTLYHPGDSFSLPGQQVDVLCAPISGPWLKMAESIDFARAIGAPHVLAIHDRLLSDVGLGMTDTRMARMLADHGSAYQRVPDGEDAAL